MTISAHVLRMFSYILLVYYLSIHFMYKFYTLNETIVLQLFLGILLLLTSAQNFVGFLRGIELSLYYLAENLEESVF